MPYLIRFSKSNLHLTLILSQLKSHGPAVDNLTPGPAPDASIATIEVVSTLPHHDIPTLNIFPTSAASARSAPASSSPTMASRGDAMCTAPMRRGGARDGRR